MRKTERLGTAVSPAERRKIEDAVAHFGPRVTVSSLLRKAALEKVEELHEENGQDGGETE